MSETKCSSCKCESSQITVFENNIAICQKCIKQKDLTESYSKSFTPKVLFDYLSKKIIGQEDAKKSLSVAIATHHCRLTNPLIKKSNILLIGPTGTGKTEMARTLSQITSLPFAIIDATTLTAHGYIGEDVEGCLHQLLAAANNDQKAAEEGIVFIDEIDKLSRGQEGENSGGIATVRVQQSLLKMIEGGTVKLSKSSNNSSKGADKDFILFDTSKILFICSGAFPGLEDLITKKDRQIGLNQLVEDNNSNGEIKVNHLSKYGLISELLGRLPIIIRTNPLTEKDLYNILTKTENCLTDQFQLILKSYGVELNFTPSFLKDVVKESMENSLGARGLRAIMEKKLQQVMFEGPSYRGSKILMTAEGFKLEVQEQAIKKSKPIIQERKNKQPIVSFPEIAAEDSRSSKIRAQKKS